MIAGTRERAGRHHPERQYRQGAPGCLPDSDGRHHGRCTEACGALRRPDFFGYR